MRSRRWRLCSALAWLCPFWLGGCSTLLEQHLTANQELVANCETLAAEPPPAPASLVEYLQTLESRAWPTLGNCPAAASQLQVVWSDAQPGKVLVRGLTPIAAPAGSTVTVDAQKRHLVLGRAEFQNVQVIDGPTSGTRTGQLKSVELVLPPGESTAESLVACGLAQTAGSDGAALAASEKAVRDAVRDVDARARHVSVSWQGFRKSLDPRRLEVKPAHQTYREWLFQGDQVLTTWLAFQSGLDDLLRALDVLETAVRAVPAESARRDFHADLLAFAANARVALRKAKTIALDEGKVLRDYAKGRVTENVAHKYLNALDRALLPLERGFGHLDEKAYGLGTATLFASNGQIDKLLYQSYDRVQQSLCKDKCPAMKAQFDRAVGRAACKRLDEPREATRSDMMMQYVYRLYARIGAKEVERARGAGTTSSKAAAQGAAEEVALLVHARAKGSAAPQVPGAAQDAGTERLQLSEDQLVQHALAEWTVRGEMLGRDLKDQIRPLPVTPGRVAPALPATVVAPPPDESEVEAHATAQAAGQIAEAWARFQTEGGSQDFAREMKVQNTVAVSQQVSVRIVNQQSVVNNLRVEPAASQVRFESGAIQVHVPAPATGAPPSSPQFCAGSGLARCLDMPSGFQWTLPGFELRSATAMAMPEDYARVAALVAQVQRAYPDRRVRIEVHGFASKEPYECPALRSISTAGAERQFKDFAPPCDGPGNANPRLSFDRAAHVWHQLHSRIPATQRLHFAPPLARGAFEDPAARKVEVRVFAEPV